jgi:addiction module RelE/StbE family toxin
MRLIWTRRALRDIDDLRTYIGQDNPAAARGQALHILSAVERLTRFPDSGRPGRVAGTRELVVGQTPFLVAYRARGDAVEVLAVLHGRRRWPNRF